ncbi:MAG: hypothetical protein DHS20C02_15660 [Micavibrio sp.]|nr:MAG: hypothetical protein DHS20C02_15660 [Micavibrio sp.]
MKADELYEKCGGLIKKYRNRLNKMKQQELADKVGLSRTSVANIEAGKQSVSLHQLYSFAEHLQVDVQELLPDSSSSVEGGERELRKKLPKGSSEELRDWAINVINKG